MTPTAQITFGSASILTRQLQNIFPVNGTAVGQVMSRDVFQVDPQCPFFYLFAMGGQGDASDGDAFQTQFDFTNGGSPICSIVNGWGNQATLNAAGIPFVSVLTTPNDGIGYFIDVISGTCSSVSPATLFWQGFIKRWTALADQITVTTTALDASDSGSPYGVVHGILQQPW